MNFQEKTQARFIEAASELRAQAAALAATARTAAVERAELARKRLEGRLVNLRGTLATLGEAGRDLNLVARQHALRFVKENTALATAAGKDMTKLARTTYSTLAGRTKTKAVARPKRAAAKRKVRKAA